MNVFTTTLVTLAITLAIAVMALNYKLDSARKEVDACQQQILMLKLDSEQQEARVEQANAEAQAQVKQIQNKTQAILRTKVSSNCEESIKWLIKQAHSL